MNRLFARLKQWFYNLSLVVKVCVVVYAIVIVALSILFVFLRNTGINIVSDELKAASKRSTAHGILLIKKEQTYLLGLASNYAISNEVQSAIHDSNSNVDVLNNIAPTAPISDITSESQYLMCALSLVFYDKSGKVVDYMAIDASKQPINQDPLDYSRPFGRLIGKEGGRLYEWEFIPQYDDRLFMFDHSPKITLWYLIRDNSTKNTIGGMALSLDSRKLLAAQTVADSSCDALIILDENGNLLDGSGMFQYEHSDIDIEKLLCQVDMNNECSESPIKVQGIEYYVNCEQAQIPGCYIYSFISSDANVIGRKYLVSTIIGIFLCTFLILPMFLFAAKFISRPLEILTSAMNEYASGNQSVEIMFSGKDEIGRIGEIFNYMVKRNSEMMKEKCELVLLKQQAEYAILQVEIDPHFICNLLNLLQWMALENKDNEMAELVNSTSAIIRYSLNYRERFAFVSEEVDLVIRYLKIQKRLLGDRLNYQFNIGESTENLSVPKFIIQMLVENSIKHGLKKDGSQLIVEVTTSLNREHDTLQITVEDNGKGFDAASLTFIPVNEFLSKDRYYDNQEGRTLGALRNIYYRLAIYYGENNHAMNVLSSVEKGTRIELTLPKVPDMHMDSTLSTEA